MTDGQWWAFDRPVLRDPLFLPAVAIGLVVAVAAGAALSPAEAAWGRWLWQVVGGGVSAWFGAGVVLGTVRNVARGYRRANGPRPHDGAERP